MIGYVYLLCDAHRDLYKIGVTKNSVEKRVRQLQTGCGTPIHIVDTFKSEDYYRIETLLHRQFGHKKEQGEWFSLDSSDVVRFNEYCKQMQSLIDCMKENPFYK